MPFSSENPSTTVRPSLVGKLFRFLLAGLPSFVVAIPLNKALVDGIGLWKPAAYAIVLFVQVTINFFLCRAFVFKVSRTKPILRQYAEFLAAITVFRVVDWALYTAIVSWVDRAHPIGLPARFPDYYILVQLFNVAFLAFFKFFFCRTAIEGKQSA